MDLKSLLRQLPVLEDRLFNYEGEWFPVPYHTFTYQGVKVQGLREVDARVQLIRKLVLETPLESGDYKYSRVVELGCNLGAVLGGVADLFDSALGYDCDPVPLKVAEILFPGISFFCINLDEIPPHKLFAGGMARTVLALSMLEYVKNKPEFISSLYRLTGRLCVVEGHSEDIARGRDREYDSLLREVPWSVERLQDLTDAGLNAPKDSPGRPVWVCRR